MKLNSIAISVICDFFLEIKAKKYSLYKRGSVIQIYLILKKLVDDKKINVEVYQMGKENKEVDFNGIKVNIIESKNWDDYKQKLNYQCFKGDIIHYNNIDLYLESIKGKIITATIHTNAFLEKSEAMKWLDEVNNKLSRLIVVNSAYYNKMTKKYKNVKLIKNGICLNKFKYLTIKMIDNTINILFPNLDLPKKNRAFAIELIKKLNEVSHYNYKLLLVGNKDTNFNENESIEFIGETEPGKEMNASYHNAYITIIPSISESCSLCALESMASGTVVIANNTIGIKDYVSNGKTGYLVNIGDMKKWIDTIELLVEDENHYRLIQKEGRKNIENYFNIERVAQEYYNLWLNDYKGGKI